jgi:hypothetical protein
MPTVPELAWHFDDHAFVAIWSPALTRGRRQYQRLLVQMTA